MKTAREWLSELNHLAGEELVELLERVQDDAIESAARRIEARAKDWEKDYAWQIEKDARVARACKNGEVRALNDDSTAAQQLDRWIVEWSRSDMPERRSWAAEPDGNWAQTAKFSEAHRFSSEAAATAWIVGRHDCYRFLDDETGTWRVLPAVCRTCERRM